MSIEFDPIDKPVATDAAVAGVTVEPQAMHSEWNTGLCGCFSNCGVLCQTLCCYRCTQSNVYSKLESAVATCSCGTYCGSLCTDCCSCCQQSAWGCLGTRREVIARYNIAGESMCCSVLKCCCCPSCSFCQTQREMILRNEGAGGCCAQGSAPGNVVMMRAPDAPLTMAQQQPNNGQPYSNGQPYCNGQPVQQQQQFQQPQYAQQQQYGATSPYGATGTTPYGAPVFYGQPRPIQQWGSGTCGCNCTECCDIMCCSHFTLGYIAGKIDALHNIGDPSKPSVDLCICCLSTCNPCAITYMNRRELIQRYNIVGESHIDSCCTVYFCTACAVSQQRREMGYHEEFPGGCFTTEAPIRQQ